MIALRYVFVIPDTESHRREMFQYLDWWDVAYAVARFDAKETKVMLTRHNLALFRDRVGLLLDSVPVGAPQRAFVERFAAFAAEALTHVEEA